MGEDPEPTRYLSAADILTIHELIVESNEDTEPGVSSRGDVEYAVEAVREGHFGQAPETIHETAYQLLRLIASNHPFVDGNKRTALMSVRIFYALNGLEFDYDRRIKEILKELATDEAAVEAETATAYLRDHTEPLSPEYRATVELWLSRIGAEGSRPTDLDIEGIDEAESEQNGYDDGSRRDE
ncbi:prophage maintenance system killer protein [Halalkaliarchaeum desulfuricum]|uniref:Prophage maintenance system killer protein n=1 Tax=Halalkaliarchaeum desulfuricum TaxID=2055893 RepID=A0A343TGT9_9EURY|nr:type II toxin-antitoxin system death-on-curing family toxin [Halalkaliarchaeum desulfuricum]AUX08311.1 prophage maintenance system killer protein [Halalkaliarchaeum desulfuricum]